MISTSWLLIALAAVQESGQPPPKEARELVGPDGKPAFGPERTLQLSLEGAFEIALQYNLGLKIEKATLDAARFSWRASWGAFDWTVGGSAGVRDSEFQPRDVFGGSSENSQDFSVDFTRPLTTGGTFGAHFDTVNTRSDSAFQVQPLSTTDVVSLTYTQPLLRGAWREYATAEQRLAEIDYLRADENERAARQRLLLDVSNAYWDLVAARAELTVVESSVNLAVSQVDQNQRRLDAGVGVTLDLIQAQADLAKREEARLLAEVTVRQRADALRTLLFPGTDADMWDTNLEPTTPLPNEVTATATPTWTAAFAVALEHRPDLAAQRLAIETESVRYERAHDNKKPTLNLDLTASSQGFSSESAEAFETAAAYDFPTYRAALVFNYPLANTSARNLEKVAWANLRAARLAYDESETRVVSAVRDAVRQVHYQAEAVRAAQKSVDLAQRQLAAEEARLQAEISTNFQLLQFQQDLAQAQSSEVLSRANFAKAEVVLLSAQGLLGEIQNP